LSSDRRIVVGMSGGVDSSVAAWLLKQQGYDVVGLFMKNWEDDDRADGDGGEYCSSRQDWLDAASAADVIGIDIEAVNFAAEYRERVFSEFLREYSAGRTPNPDVLCNAEIKFKAFLDHALASGGQQIATGHYARIRTLDGSRQLLRAVDGTKDQSYFLHRLTQHQLKRTLFPLGELRKTEVRALARQIGLANAAKRDSTGICFIGERPFRAFLSRYLPAQPGPIRAPSGQVLGEHTGLSFYTLGQRKGIGVGGMQHGSGEPWFVARKDLEHNTLWVVQGHDHPWLLSDRLVAASAAWVAGAPEAGRRLTAKTRYRQADAQCRVLGADAQRLELEFTTPQWAVTPGQSAVLYDGEVCLGGAIIETTDVTRMRGGAVQDASRWADSSALI
jgi:tRNA-specific 2-thiouridylase